MIIPRTNIVILPPLLFLSLLLVLVKDSRTRRRARPVLPQSLLHVSKAEVVHNLSNGPTQLFQDFNVLIGFKLLMPEPAICPSLINIMNMA